MRRSAGRLAELARRSHGGVYRVLRDACLRGRLLLLLACGFVCAGFLLVALFSMAMWLFTRDTHALHVMLGYFGYSGGTFAVITAPFYYHGKFLDGMKARQGQHIANRRASHVGLINSR